MKKVFSDFILGALLFSFLSAQEWEQSFIAGNFDINGLFMGGSEVLNLVAHKNKLFASIGYWEDENNIWYGGNDFGDKLAEDAKIRKYLKIRLAKASVSRIVKILTKSPKFGHDF